MEEGGGGVKEPHGGASLMSACGGPAWPPNTAFPVGSARSQPTRP